MVTLTIDEVEESLRQLPKDHSLFSLDKDRPEVALAFIDNILDRANSDLVTAEGAQLLLNSADGASQLARKMGFPQGIIDARYSALDFLLRGALITHRNAHNLWPNSDTTKAFDDAILTVKKCLAAIEAIRLHPSFTPSKNVH